jgi:hypothetical protein
MPNYRNNYGGDPHNRNDSRAGRVYVWETVDVDDQDRGANDEGYYYAWCDSCCKRTEHINFCLECG